MNELLMAHFTICNLSGYTPFPALYWSSEHEVERFLERRCNFGLRLLVSFYPRLHHSRRRLIFI